ncbi:hypothetical protein LL912_09670 [Niabella sp. CC-SYL272]|uniref:hypothetical protein n=1 Tax=Niabella agricola TaxID=2891571 RepID=UPI001F4460FA|nr:hypothetical protein [Niabella agricola]MCF3109044.1 hypothetical protein [Niabella agricola]
MKKIMLSALILAATAYGANAQTQKGYYLIGGNLALLSGSTNEKSFQMNITPKVAWFVQEDLAIGGKVDLGFKAGRAQKPSINYFVGPMARYYFGEQQVNTPKQTRVFAEADAGVSGNNAGGKSTNGFGAGIGPGLAFFVNENIALEALAKANIITGAGSNGVSFRPELGLGFQIYLPGSKLKQMRNDMK